MHDEAAAHYSAMIEQTTLGHKFLLDEFNVTPNIGWQIDPFGHSNTQASLLSGYLGFDALMFARSDYQDLEFRSQNKQLEMIWRGSESLGQTADVFTLQFFGGVYGPPPTKRLCDNTFAPDYDPYCPMVNYYASQGRDGFDFEGRGNDPIMDDPDLEDFNVDQKVELFVQESLKMFDVTVGNDILFTFGNDFNYMNAQEYFINLDKLVHYVNLDGRVNLFYSSPHDYVLAKNSYVDDGNAEEQFAWPLKTDDFFPYADSYHAFWTGYFTSRAATKGLNRVASSYLNVARQLQLFSGKTTEVLQKLWEAVSINQHHDAVTGTAKQAVSDDYALRMTEGIQQAQQVVNVALHDLIYNQSQPKISEDVQLTQCEYLNVSICSASVRLSQTDQKGFSAVVYNPLAWSREEWVRIPVSSPGPYRILDPSNQQVQNEVVPVPSHTKNLQKVMLKYGLVQTDQAFGNYEVVFQASMPAVGYSMYRIKKVVQGTEHVVDGWEFGNQDNEGEGEQLTVSNGMLSLTYNRKEGKLSQICMDSTASCLPVEQDMMYYIGSDGVETERVGQASGAYIFRVKGGSSVHSCAYDIETYTNKTVDLQVYRGSQVSEVVQTFSSWCVLTTRLYKNQPFVELEWTVGPIPFVEAGPFEGLGREVISRFQTQLASDGEFWTDSNGREMQKRTFNQRPSFQLHVTDPIEGNYYPITSALEIRDPNTDLRFSIITERGQGASSLSPGQLEVMLHRVSEKDDWRGVGENLNETMCGCRDCDCEGLIVRGKHVIVVGVGDKQTQLRTNVQQRVNDPPVLLFGALPDEAQENGIRASWSFFEQGGGLPPNLHLLTLMEWEPSTLLVRLAHLYEVGSVPSLSKEVTVDISGLLNKYYIVRKVTQVSLTANQLAETVAKNKLKWRTQGQPFYNVYQTNKMDQPSDIPKEATENVLKTDEPEMQIQCARKLSSVSDETQNQVLDGASVSFVDTVQPMEIKTYLVKVEKKQIT
eukprot:TRINITY_DN4390_c0_g6_i1.p1 TRINITY_DN4390_c0_g6~~TRINITY_DN4390_c0_g6_i1.p1  ORF type:complete len:1134 (-),score=134.28 TRINITY_DN4390_c0_g6_i1:1148-4105(-)